MIFPISSQEFRPDQKSDAIGAAKWAWPSELLNKTSANLLATRGRLMRIRSWRGVRPRGQKRSPGRTRGCGRGSIAKDHADPATLRSDGPLGTRRGDEGKGHPGRGS